MSLMVESVVDRGMDVEKPLRGSRRFEPLHLALSSPHDLMGVFSAIVFSAAPIMRAATESIWTREARSPRGIVANTIMSQLGTLRPRHSGKPNNVPAEDIAPLKMSMSFEPEKRLRVDPDSLPRPSRSCARPYSSRADRKDLTA